MSEQSPIFDREPSGGAEITAEFDAGFSWIAHPDERGKRASHAIATDEGVWLVDPLDAPNVDERIESLGEVAGVLVLTCWHARDAEAFAERYDVAVHAPTWLDRIDDLVDAPIERYSLSPAEEFRTITSRPFPLWQEQFLYHEPSGTLVVPDSMGTTDPFLVGDQRLGLELVRRLQPPTQLSGLEPERILVGHGEPVTGDAPAALSEALSDGRRSFFDSLQENGEEAIRSLVQATLD
jgi:hypothetical protein